MRQAIVPRPLPPHIVNMKKQRKGSVREVEHGVFTPIVLSTTGSMGREAIEDWQMEFHERRESHIQSSWGGFDVVSPSQPSILLSCAFVEADLLVTTPYMNKTFLLLHQRAMFPLPHSEVCCLLFFILIVYLTYSPSPSALYNNFLQW